MQTVERLMEFCLDFPVVLDAGDTPTIEGPQRVQLVRRLGGQEGGGDVFRTRVAGRFKIVSGGVGSFSNFKYVCF